MSLAARLLALCLAAALVGCGCSGEEEHAAPGGGGSSGTGASAGSAGTGAVASGGAAGATPKDSGLDGPATGPKWVPIPGELYGCSFERLANPGEFQAFTWKPCAGTPGCEEAVFDSNIWQESTDWLLESALVVTALDDDGATTRASVVIDRFGDPLLIFIVADDGTTLDGFRTNKPLGECTASASLYGKQLGVFFVDNQIANFGLMLGGVGQSEPELKDLVGHPPVGTAGRLAMGTSRWAFGWVLPHRIVSVSNADGSDFRTVATSDPTNGPVLEVDDPVTAGDYFLYYRYVVDQIGPGAHWDIAITDGVNPGTEYLVPPPGESYGAPAYAHSSVAWMRGIGTKSVNTYDSVEVWTSPWSPDPSKLQPKKLGVLKFKGIDPGAVGGWGHYAVARLDEGVDVYDLAAGTVSVKPIPAGKHVWRYFGITQTHLWMGARDDPTVNRADYLLRYSVNP